MSDAFGSLPIPLVAPTNNEAAGDPLLSKTLAFFAAVLNANAPAAWGAVYKDQDADQNSVVSFTSPNAPAMAAFTDKNLPGLFFWRESAMDPVWIADDWLTQQSCCPLVWIPRPTTYAKRALRSAIVNGVARTLLTISERNRDPSWIDPGDPDPLAATLGSSFFGRAGWLEFDVGKWRPISLSIPTIQTNAKPGKPILYDALRIECTVIERLNYDLTRFDALAGVEVTIKTPDGGVGDGGVVTGHAILT